jgi:hypothetical protein
MALQSSGQISLNDIHVEAGGTSGTQCSLNDSDIRGLIGKASGATSSFSGFYGASGSIFSATVTVGRSNTPPYYAYGYSNGNTSYIYQGMSFGSITSTNLSALQSGMTLAHVSYFGSFNIGSRLHFEDNTTPSNSGWTTLQIGTKTLSRSSASFVSGTNTNSGSQGQYANWTWNDISTGNPFGTTSGVTKTVLIS